MSNQMYNKLWHSAQKYLEDLAVDDYQKQVSEIIELDRITVQRSAFELYTKYKIIANKLEEIYDQMVQPQKRILVRKLLDMSLGRVIELKHDLVNIDIMEFSYNDAVMAELKVTPNDVELRIPRYFLRENENEIAYKKDFIDNLMMKLGWLEEAEEIVKVTELEAIRVIQMHERARQGRLRAQFMKEIKQLKEKGKPDASKGKTDGLVAAMKIQKVWRGFVTRQRTRRGKLDEMYLIGMIPKPDQVNHAFLEEEEKRMQRRYKLQVIYQENYTTLLNQVKDAIKKKHTVPLSEEIADEVRKWFKEYHEKTGKFPEFPSEESGGSRYLLSRQTTDSELSRSSALSSKDSKKTKDKSKTPTKSAEIIDENNFEDSLKISQSTILPEIKRGIDEYNEIWRYKDESANFQQTHYEDMIYTDKYSETETEIRKIIDDIMRQELDHLQNALDRDRALKGKKTKKASKKARRSGKKSKKKKEKDLTPDRTTESLFEELVTNGIIKKYPEKPLNTFLGDCAYTERPGINVTPGDIRQLMIEYAILPLGSDTIRNIAPCIKSMLITGPKGTGKRSLVHSICTETGALLFDLTPANIVGKYPGKSGLIMLMHLVLKVSRLLQPAVIFMDNAEAPFMKKVPKGDRTDPKRLKKDLSKLIKNICAEDRVIFIGTSSSPWDADQKLLQQVYSRFIYVPRPDYGTLSFIWKKLLSNYPSINPNFDTGAMAKISDGYTVGPIIKSIEEVLTCKRNLQLKIHPLAHVELINSLSTRDPVYREEEEAFNIWWCKTPLGRKKQRAIEMEIEAKLEKEKAKEKKGRKKSIAASFLKFQQ